jgi:hypothetical protein
MARVFWIWLFVLATDLASAAPADGIQGTWRLTEALIPTLADSNPNGIPAVKEHYSADGRLYFIGPDAVMDAKTQWANYRIEGNKRIARVGAGPEYVATIEFPTPDTLVVIQARGDRWRYVRIKSDNAVNLPIEPLSVEVLKPKDGGANPPIEYDTRDYSALPLDQRLVGTWEVVEHRGVAQAAAPPYGYLNDVWVFDGSKRGILARAKASMDAPSASSYSVKQGAIEIEGNDRPVPVSFNSWGHVTLDFSGHMIRLKLISKDASGKLPLPPVKITLLRLKQR